MVMNFQCVHCILQVLLRNSETFSKFPPREPRQIFSSKTRFQCQYNPGTVELSCVIAVGFGLHSMVLHGPDEQGWLITHSL